MPLYRFSPIKDKETLLQAIAHVHAECHKLCKQSLGEYLPNTGNIGIFCHYDDEFELLKKIREEMTESSDNVDQKYFRLHEPIVIPAEGDIPACTYTHLYIRKPDPYRHHVGDLDFYLESEKYEILKQNLKDGKKINGARAYIGALDMVELYNPDSDVLGYISTHRLG